MTSATRTWAGTTLADRRAIRREQLITAGVELMGGGDTSAVSVRAVCRTAKLTERYFYESFPDRDALMLATYEHVAEKARDAILQSMTGIEPKSEQLARAAVTAFVELLIDDPRKGTVLLLAPLTEPALNRRGLELLPAFTALIREQLPDTDDVARKLTATSLIGGLTYLFVSYLDGSLDVPRDRLIEHAVTMLVNAASP